MKTWRVLACVLALSVPGIGHSQSIEALKQQLEAQKHINELLKQRIRSLEAQLLDKQDINATFISSDPFIEPEPIPETEVGDPEESRALERALVRRGLSILPLGQWELTPGLA